MDERDKIGGIGGRTVRANCKMSASVMAAWRTTMGAARAVAAKRDGRSSFIVIIGSAIED
jgi:hypothetical protein